MQLENLNTEFLGRNVVYFETIDSTQDEIWRLYKNEETKNGTLVMANLQTKGKGTHGRKWYTDEKGNIAFSFLIKLNCNVQKLEGLTTKIAQIIQSIMKEKYNIEVGIKEPNDIILNGKKLGGILTETKVIKGRVKCLGIGIGININQEHFAKEIESIATSIKKETNKTINAKEFIAEFCNQFEKYLKEEIKWEK